MAIARAIFILALGWCFILASSENLRAQILDGPAPQSSEGLQQASVAATDAEKAGDIQRVGWFNIPMPKITMPKFTMPKIAMPKMPPLWPSDSNDESPALLAPVAAGFNKISAGTKKAWEGAKEVFSAGNGKNASTAQPRPSLWQRLVARAPKSDGPKTVGEFMSQPRLNP